MEFSVKQSEALFDSYMTQFKDGDKLLGLLKYGSIVGKSNELTMLVKQALDRGEKITDAEVRVFMRVPDSFLKSTTTD